MPQAVKIAATACQIGCSVCSTGSSSGGSFQMNGRRHLEGIQLDALEDPTAYRPICLLDTLGNLYEQQIQGRPEDELERGEVLSDQQYGFGKGRSTIQAVQRMVSIVNNSEKTWCVLITLDIRNAFNMAPWCEIRTRMREIGISGRLVKLIDSYLRNRKLVLGRGTGLDLDAGILQESVLRPVLWNILCYPVVRLHLQQGCQTVEFADDLALLVEADNKLELMTKAGYALDGVPEWMRGAKLSLSAHKSEALCVRPYLLAPKSPPPGL